MLLVFKRVEQLDDPSLWGPLGRANKSHELYLLAYIIYVVTAYKLGLLYSFHRHYLISRGIDGFENLPERPLPDNLKLAVGVWT